MVVVIAFGDALSSAVNIAFVRYRVGLSIDIYSDTNTMWKMSNICTQSPDFYSQSTVCSTASRAAWFWANTKNHAAIDAAKHSGIDLS